MKFTSKKRGFTIIELVIVIAVVAILAAVLIPVFSNLVQQGKDADAKVVVRNLNTGLKMETSKPQTMHDALAAVEKNVGINVAKLNETYTKTGNQIVWDSEYNTFLYIKADGSKVSAPDVTTFTSDNTKLWAVANSKSEVAGEYSYYWNGGDITDGITVTTGFDAGEAEIDTITYATENTQTVAIRTNSEKTILTINAKNSDVYHYDVVGNVNVVAVKSASYHENGSVVGTLDVASGHVKVENGADVASIVASKTESATKASVTAANGASVGTVVVNDAAATITVESGATVAEVAPGKDVTIDTSKVTGITPSTTVIDTEKASDFAGGLGTEASPYLIANTEQFVNIGKFSDEMQLGNSYSFKMVADVDLSKESISAKSISNYFCGILDGNENVLYANNTLSYLFTDVVDKVTIKNVMYTLKGENVKFIGGMIEASKLPDITFDNVDISNAENASKVILHENEGLYFGWTGCSVNTNKYGSFGTQRKINLAIKNCDVNVDIIGYSYNAVFFGGGLYFTDAVIENCIYNGNYAGDSLNLVLGNASPYGSTINIKNVVNKGTLSSTVATPKIALGNYSADNGVGNTSWETKVNSNNGTTLKINITNCMIGTANSLIEKNLAVAVNGSNKNDCQISATQATNETVDYYLLTLVGGRRIVSDSSENSTYRLYVKIAKENLENTIADFKTGKFVVKSDIALVGLVESDLSNAKSYSIYGEKEQDKVYLVEKDGAFYYVCDFETRSGFELFFNSDNNDKTVHGSVDINSVELTAYAADNTPVGKSIVKWNSSKKAWN